MRTKPPWRTLALAQGLALTSGCLVETVTTEIRVRDPHAVTVHDGQDGVAIAPGHGPAEGALGEGHVPTGEHTTARYTVTARRAEDGSIHTGWRATVPLAGGDADTILPADGGLSLAASGPRVVRDDPATSSALWLSFCTRMVEHHARHDTGWHTEPVRCVGDPPPDRSEPGRPGTVAYSLEIPWSQVTDLREHGHPDRAAAWGLMALATVVSGGLGVFVGAEPDGWFAGGQPVRVGLTSLLMGGAVAIDLALLRTLLAHDRDVPLRDAR